MPNITGGIIRGNTKIVSSKVPLLELAVSALKATPIKLIVRVTNEMQIRKFKINSNLKPISKNVKHATVIMLKQLVSQYESAFASDRISSEMEHNIKRSAVPSLKSLLKIRSKVRTQDNTEAVHMDPMTKLLSSVKLGPAETALMMIIKAKKAMEFNISVRLA